jgi:DNA-binding SARP family transcriptional activator
MAGSSYRDERQRELIRRSNMVRLRATRELISRHLEEYRELYGIEAAKLGVTPSPDVGAKRKTAEEAIEEVRRSGLVDGVEVPVAHELPDSKPPSAEVLRIQRQTRAEILADQVEGSVPAPPWEV